MSAGQPNDAELVQAAQRDPSAFDALYRRWVAPVYRFVLSRVGDVQDAEDVTSAVFGEALNGLSGYEEQGHFVAWLFTIARRQVTGHRRRARPEAEFDPRRAEVAVGPGGAAEREGEQIMLGLAALDDISRDAIALRFLADLPVKEVAAVLGKGESATKMTLHRALIKMRSALEDYDG